MMFFREEHIYILYLRNIFLSARVVVFCRSWSTSPTADTTTERRIQLYNFQTLGTRTHPPVTLLSLRTVFVVAALVKGKASLVDILVHQSHNTGLVRSSGVVGSPQEDLPDYV